MKQQIQDLADRTDLLPWYWYSYGEAEYGFAVIEAFPINEKDPFPEPGSELKSGTDENNAFCWVGKNGTKMLIEAEISSIESQNGDAICNFIASAHAELMKDHIKI